MSLEDLHIAIARGTVDPDVALREARRIVARGLAEADVAADGYAEPAEAGDQVTTANGLAEVRNRQEAPYPWALHNIVAAMTYRPGWTFDLADIDRGQGSAGLTLIVVSQGYDTYNPDRGETYRVHHYMPVPPAAFDAASWRRWVLDQLLAIETHEACEFLVVDGQRPFAPVHAPGHDPYVVRQLARVEDAETTFRGERREGSQA